jgi:hypothetical protein
MTERGRFDDAQIDAALRRQFEPPQIEGLLQRVSPSVPSVRYRLWPWAALAAAALLAFLLRSDRPRSEVRVADAQLIADSQLLGMWVDTYHETVAAGFDAAGCCDASSDLRAQCEAKFAMALEVADTPELRVCGAYCGRTAGGAVTIMVRAGATPVCLFVLPRERAPQRERTVIGELVVHRREIGRLAVFEVSPAGEPRVLSRLYEP